ncbi:MAG: GHKL domain-containing protein [Chitinophagaceae bacterium]|nr:GHKL domain-containing protein [Chitinophagaceae bacterium]
MQDVKEFFKGLFATDRWPPRWKCGYWSDFHGWMYIISDLMIWLAYFLIPLIIISYFKNKKTAIRFQNVYLLFAAFILLCGSTHFLDAMMFWFPMYRLNGVVRFLTAVASLFTVYYLVKILPQVNKMRTALELENEIARREEVEKDLEEANKRLAAFASVASHDLQEPLRKIRTFADVLYIKNKDSFDPLSKENTEKIIHSATRMQALVSDVLILSSINDGVELEAVNLEETIKESIDSLELFITEKNAVINVSPLPVIKGNPAYLTQLFTNLISNAIKFNEQVPEINIRAEETNGEIIISVTDNGIGMLPEYHEKVFEAFKRINSKTKYPGTGIGLAICKRIMEIHHGTINVESTKDKGSSFILHFPLS